MKTSNLKNQIEYFQTSKTTLFMVLLGLICVGITSCKKQDSEKIPVDSSIFQDYMVTFSASNTMAYAIFSDKNNKINDIQLTKDQSISANGKPMNYRNLGENKNILLYPYSASLDNATDVTFKFTRAKDKVYNNSLKKADIKAISIPADLTTIDKTKSFSWTGDAILDGETINGSLSSTNGDNAAVFSVSLTADKKQLMFNMAKDIPAGKYSLLIMRSKVIDTKENNTPASGKIKIAYIDKKDIIIQ